MNRNAASSVLLEVIATTVGDAKAAARAGADRLELVTAITEGGLTPSVGIVEAVVAAVPIPVNVIVRPHSRSFVYDADDLRVIERDVRAAVAAGANGVVFGALDARGDVDLGALARIAAAADGRALTFHRAFDVSRDLNAAFDALLRVPAVTSVLTSGGHPSVLDAVATITRLARQAAGSTCTVLAGSAHGRCGRRFRPRDRRARGAFRLGVRPRGEVLAPVDQALVERVRAAIDGAAAHV